MRLFALFLAGGESYLPPNSTLVRFSPNGVSEEVDEETFHACLSISGHFYAAGEDQIANAIYDEMCLGAEDENPDEVFIDHAEAVDPEEEVDPAEEEVESDDKPDDSVEPSDDTPDDSTPDDSTIPEVSSEVDKPKRGRPKT